MARSRKGKVPPQLRAYLFKKGGSSRTRKRRSAPSLTMAKRKRSRRSGRSSFTSGLPMKEALYSAGYGFVRRDIVGVAAPVISMVPAGDYSDNVTLGLGAYVLSRFISNGMVRDACKTIIVNEAFLAGAKARAGASLSVTQTAGVSTSSAYL